MFKPFILPVTAFALLACPALASDPKSARVEKLVKLERNKRPIEVGQDVIMIPPQARPMPQRRPVEVRVIEIVESPIKSIGDYLKSPSSGLRRLLDESEGLRKAREEFRRLSTGNTVRPF